MHIGDGLPEYVAPKLHVIQWVKGLPFISDDKTFVVGKRSTNLSYSCTACCKLIMVGEITSAMLIKSNVEAQISLTCNPHSI